MPALTKLPEALYFQVVCPSVLAYMSKRERGKSSFPVLERRWRFLFRVSTNSILMPMILE